jgi:pimeloyl-ACP methyl ester carboxylesterase
MQIVVDGLLTNYQCEGKKGPAVVLVHGWGDKLQTYEQLAKHLASKHQVVRLDLPGFGATQPPATTWGLIDYAGFVRHFLDKLNLKPVTMVGHSNGGAVLIKGVATGQLKPQRLVLLASAGVRNRQSLRKLLLKLVAKTGKLLTRWLPARVRRNLQRRFYGTIGSDYLVAPHLQETFKQTVAEDILNDAAQITVPTLLIYGDHDTATPVEQIGVPLHQAIKNSKLHIVHGADHFVHHHSLDEVSRSIEDFTS